MCVLVCGWHCGLRVRMINGYLYTPLSHCQHHFNHLNLISYPFSLESRDKWNILCLTSINLIINFYYANIFDGRALVVLMISPLNPASTRFIPLSPLRFLYDNTVNIYSRLIHQSLFDLLFMFILSLSQELNYIYLLSTIERASNRTNRNKMIVLVMLYIPEQ